MPEGVRPKLVSDRDDWGVRSKFLTYMPALDGLRGIAVLLVFVHHAFPWIGIPDGLAVDVFFVISGWLITWTLLKECRKTELIRSPARAHLTNISVAYNLSSVEHHAHAWSLAMEDQFYLVWPLVLLAVLSLNFPGESSPPSLRSRRSRRSPVSCSL